MNSPENINTTPEPYTLPLEGLPEPEHAAAEVATQHSVQGILPFKVPGAITAISPESAEQAKRGWKVKLNGAEVSDVSEVDIENDKLGLKLRYGKTETGYD